MRSHLLVPAVSVGALAMAGLPTARGADADLEALKAQFQAQFKRLEKRIETLETENARLKRDAAAAPGAKVTPEIASLKQRVTELELATDSASPVANDTARRAAANAEAIEAIQRKLHASATETRDVYRDDAAGRLM